jgi:hypothetical protein
MTKGISCGEREVDLVGVHVCLKVGVEAPVHVHTISHVVI